VEVTVVLKTVATWILPAFFGWPALARLQTILQCNDAKM